MEIPTLTNRDDAILVRDAFNAATGGWEILEMKMKHGDATVYELVPPYLYDEFIQEGFSPLTPINQ